MNRYLDKLILNDLASKMVILTGPRQVGKTTLSRQLMGYFNNAQYLNWDVLADRAILQRQSWDPRAGLLVLAIVAGLFFTITTTNRTGAVVLHNF